MLNILYATTSTSLSGGTRQLINNAVGMAEAGHSVTVCCFAGASLIHELTDSKNIVISIIEQNSLRGRLSFFRHLLVTRNIHVVHCFHNKLYKYFLLLRFMCPRFKLFLNRGVIFAPGSFPLFYLPQLTGIICNSWAAADVLKKYHVPSKKLHVIYNAVIPSAQPTLDTHAKKQTLTILYIGNKQPYKGLDIFLQTVAALIDSGLKDVYFIVAGIKKKPEFERIISPAILNMIEFKGALPHEKLFDLLCKTDIFVITSRQESLPNTLIEAYAAGVPVVSTTAGGIPEVLKDGTNGFLCPINKIQCLANRIIQLANTPDLRHGMSCNNKKSFRKIFSLDAKIKNLLHVYIDNKEP
ncbi:glycosyltransferase family 4 protein [Desulfoplanes sp. PS50]